MSKYPNAELNVGSLSCGTPVRDKAKGKSHLADHPEVAAHLGPLLSEIRLGDFDERNNCVRVFDLDIQLKTDVVEVTDETPTSLAFRPGRGVGRFNTESFSARPSKFAVGAPSSTTNKLKVVLWLKPADDEEDQVVVVTTCFPGDAEPEPWSYGLSNEAHQSAVAYWKTRAFAGSMAAGLEECDDWGLFWQHNPAN